MLTITQHLWQSGAQKIQIINTILKIPEGSPQFYFYSDKRNKILRKKDQSVDYVIKQIQKWNKIQQNKQFIVFSYYSNHVNIALYNVEQVYEALSFPSSKYSYAIVCLNHIKQPLRLINITYSNDKIYSIEPFLNISKINQPCTLEQQKQIENYIKLFCRKMEQGFHKEHNKQYRVMKLNLVVNYFTQSIKVLWSQKIQFLAKNTKQTPFLSFNYDFKQYQQNPPKGKLKNVIFKLDIQSEISSICQSSNLHSNKQVQNQQTCFGCGKKTVLQKQMHINSIIQIRTLHKMPLRGLLSEYYLVCNDCYLLN